jgi:hypothetical protein
MRQHSAELLDVLSGSFTRRLFVNVFHGSDRVLEDVPFKSWSFDGAKSSAVKCSGTGTVVYASVAGESLVPEGTKGVLSPFRARIELVTEISAGDFVERVSLGTFRVTDVKSARDVTAFVEGVEVVVASEVTIEFRSLDEDVRRWGFRYPEQPPASESCYDELRRITGMPVEETLPDKPITGSPTWEAKQGGRLDAAQSLADILGGVGVVNSVGAWEVLPDAVGDPVGVIRLGERGTVLDVSDEIETDTICNEVVGTFEDDNRNPIYAIAQVTVGDLAVDSNYRPNTRYYSSDKVKTQAQADSAVQSVLDLSIGSQTYDVLIQCHINPLVELGDVLVLDGWVRPLTGELVKFAMGDGAYMKVTLRAQRIL